MLTLAAWLHDLSPFIWRFSESFGLRWYGAAYLAGFAAAYFILVALARRSLILIPAERIGDVILWIVAGTLVGGRLGYILIYERSLLTATFDHFPWWGVLAINQGGMASHGAMAGMALACWRISRGWKNERGEVVGRVPPLHVGDLLMLTAPIGLFLGRIANFVNGELLGKVVTPPGVEGPWWSVQFPQELGLPAGQIPALQQPETQSALGKLLAEAAPGRSLEAGVHAVVSQAGRYAAELKPLLASRHPSQLYQAVAEGLVVGGVMWVLWARPRKPGVLTGVFFIVYGVLRVITEIWRLPDAQFASAADGGRPWGLSRGQWLSVLMVVVGAGILLHVRSRPMERIGGWMRQRPSATRRA